MKRPKITDFIKETIANPSIELMYLKDYVKELEAYADKQDEAIAVIQCCTQLPTFDESNLNKNEYADDVQKTIHKNLCKPSYKIGWENCYGWLKQSLTK